MTGDEMQWVQKVREVARERESSRIDHDRRLAGITQQAKEAGVSVTEIADYAGMTRDGLYKLWARHRRP